MADTTFTFYDNHKPILQDGAYEVQVSQSISVVDTNVNPHQTVTQTIPPNDALTFHVAGPRFVLDQSLIQSTFPPTGGKGDYQSVLPTLVLNRSTLPWERSPSESESNAPWLFLLLIDESEKAMATENNNILLSSIETTCTPALSSDDPAIEQANFNYLALDKTLGKSIIPRNLNELQYLSYARIENGGEEKAVTLCNRLPQAGHGSTVYLVSLENNYDQSGNFSGITIKGDLMLPYLYKWEFHTASEVLYCITPKVEEKLNGLGIVFTNPDISGTGDSNDVSQSILGRVYHAADLAEFHQDLSEVTFKSPVAADYVTTIQQAAKIPGATFHELLSNLENGFGPFQTNQLSDLEKIGTIQLPFFKGSRAITSIKSNAWYRGPLVATTIELNSIANFPLLTLTMAIAENIQLNAIVSENGKWESSSDSIATVVNGLVTANQAGTCEITYSDDQSILKTQITVADNTIHLPPSTPDSLILKDIINNLDDTTYSAAFELGRLSALNDVDFATEFYKWKNETAMDIRLSKLKNQPGYTSTEHLLTGDLLKAQPLPFHLVEKFNKWKELEGIPYRYLVPDPALLPNESIRFFTLDNNWVNAFICGAFSIGHTVVADLSPYLKGLFASEQTTGFLINSLAVSGWPDFMVDISPEPSNSISLLRTDNPDVNIKTYLISGVFTALSFHLHPAKLHSGFLLENEKYQKNGKDVTSQPAPPTNVINISTLLTDLGLTKNATDSVAKFAGAMMEGTPSVKFTIN